MSDIVQTVKICTRCGVLKDFSCFSRRGKDRTHTWCKTCVSKYDHDRYLTEGSYKGWLRRHRAVQAYQRNRDVIRDFKLAHPCADCGETDPVVLDFDHLDRKTKSFNVGDMVRRGMSLTALRTEMSKCEIRCANCHRRKTYKESLELAKLRKWN